jgi:uncharacterized protein YjbI with pentapeptide repeats
MALVNGRGIVRGYQIGPGEDLQGAYLDGSNLRGANLRGADLTGAELREADLTDADLTNATLTGAKLSDAVLTRADLSHAVLTDCVMYGVYVCGTLFRETDFYGVILSGASTLDPDDPDGDGEWADFTGAYVEPALVRDIYGDTRFDRYPLTTKQVTPKLHVYG